MARPAEPTLAVANDGDGVAVTATVSGTAGVTHQLYYRTGTDASWTAGTSRVGDGTIAQAGLSAGAYHFMIQSENVDGFSIPSNLIAIEVRDTTSLAATGDLTEVEDALEDLVAASSSFQDWVGAAGDTPTKIAFARTRIYRDWQTTPTRPCACVRFDIPADYKSKAIAGGAIHRFLGTGTIGLLFENDVDSTIPDESDQIRLFKRTIDSILADMTALACSGGYLIVREFTTQEGPYRTGNTEETKDVDRFQVLIGCDFGLET